MRRQTFSLNLLSKLIVILAGILFLPAAHAQTQNLPGQPGGTNGQAQCNIDGKLGACPHISDLGNIVQIASQATINGLLQIFGSGPFGMTMVEGPPANCPTPTPGLDIFCANSQAHTVFMSVNGSSYNAIGAGCIPIGVLGDMQVNNGSGGCQQGGINDPGSGPTANKFMTMAAGGETDGPGHGIGINVRQYSVFNSGAALNNPFLVKLQGSGTVVSTNTSDTSNILGVVFTTVASSGLPVQIVTQGITSIQTDGACAAGQFIVNSSTTAGTGFCTSSPANGVQVLGMALQTTGSAGVINMYFYPLVQTSSTTTLGAGTQTTQGFTDVTSYAPGITIYDGSAHTISTAPAGTVFNGVSTLATLAALVINGKTPFSWVNSAPITGTGAYNLTNSDVPNLDIAWLAIEAALQNGTAVVPPGVYLIGTVRNLPLYSPLGVEDSGTFLSGVNTEFVGYGKRISVVKAGTDFGSGVPLYACGDPAGTFGNSLGRYATGAQCPGEVRGVGLVSSAVSVTNTIGTTPIAMTGVAWGARLRVQDVESAGFAKDWSVVGDKTTFIRARACGGAIGWYWDVPNSAASGDLNFVDLAAACTPSVAAIAVNNAATITNSVFSGDTYLQGPYAIKGETGGCTDILTQSRFARVNLDGIGNAFITDDNNFNAGVYTDGNKCRNVTATYIGQLAVNWNASNFDNTSSRARRATVDVSNVGLVVDQLSPAGNFAPPNAPSGPSSLTTFNVVTAKDTTNFVSSIRGAIGAWITSAGTKPLMIASGTSTWSNAMQISQTGQWTGRVINMVTSGNYTTTNVGDLVENDATGVAPAGLKANLALASGVVMQGGLTPTVAVPIAQTGNVNVNIGYAVPAYGVAKAGSGIGRDLIKTAGGSGGTNGTFSWTGTGGGCTTEPNGQFTVAAGTIASWTIIGHGAGCTSAPTVPTSASAGLTGATLTAIWPGGLATAAAAISDAGIIGSIGGLVTNTGAPTNQDLVNLLLGGGLN